MSSFGGDHCLDIEQCLRKVAGFKGLLSELMLGLGAGLILSEDEGVMRRSPCLTPNISPKGQKEAAK